MAKLTAKWVLPISDPPIENGVVEIEDGAIIAVGAGDAAGAIDYGQAVLMPGLVNAHSHLEYTAYRGFLEDVPFFQWIRALTVEKSRLTPDAWAWSASLGALECLASGITTVGDNADACDPDGVSATARVAASAGLRGVIFQEVFGIDNSRTTPNIIADLERKLSATSAAISGSRIVSGVSPHAPYTVRPDLMRVLAAWCAERSFPVSIHVAESNAEVELIEHGTGPFAEMFKTRGIEWTAPAVSPTHYLADLGIIGPRTLGVHCVQQSQADIEIMAALGAAIVHCPKSNAKLAAGMAPLKQWLATTGLTVALGTDSAVSNNAHDMFEEMRFAVLAQRAVTRDPVAVTARQALEMATLGGAEALGLEKVCGALMPGKRADVIAVDISGPHCAPAADPHAAVVYSARASDVLATWIDGNLVYERGRWMTLDADRITAFAADFGRFRSAGTFTRKSPWRKLNITS